ncbi:hypothetical protein N8J89_29115 [Crossiella sp. CA-258035]|uniref:hypothetical protein n=1 Tax=Crossiella sp. CA-258035 TaxID=2981138 RepID=UPI0024BC5DF0|nr:hypothetical protein [Crossiella sp. CA-258035]WHT17168.1 hypothetical protein N8J89_29115 [Crossiella sp. CA-258035]
MGDNSSGASFEIEVGFGRRDKQWVRPLSAEETVLWRGRPRKHLVLNVVDLPLLAFGALFIALMWSLTLLPSPSVPVATIVGFAVLGTVSATCISLLMPVYRVLWLRGTEYVVTGTRVLLVTTLFRRTTRREIRFGPDTRPRLAHRDAEGLGTIVFTPPGWRGLMAQFLPDQQLLPVALHSVPAAERVCALLTEAWERAVQPGPGVAR